MSGLALYGTCQVVVGERNTDKLDGRGIPIAQVIECQQPATHIADEALRLCDEHTRYALRDSSSRSRVRRLDQGGAG